MTYLSLDIIISFISRMFSGGSLIECTKRKGMQQAFASFYEEGLSAKKSIVPYRRKI